MEANVTPSAVVPVARPSGRAASSGSDAVASPLEPSLSRLAPVSEALPQARRGAASWRNYVALTKPRIISLLLLTTVAAMFVAAKGWPGTTLFAVTVVGGYLAAGAANTINMLMDRDIDARMERTASRPIVTRAISVRDAALFAGAQGVVAFALLWAFANLLTACLAMIGLLYYVGIYTAWLKRRSAHNIVIGGAAGAVPPLVGWAAVRGDLDPMAWVMFAIIFLWTPVHFWALAMLIKDDYARVGVPMLPVVQGDRRTAVQIVAYTALTVVATLAPMIMGEASAVYAVSALALNVVLGVRVAGVVRRCDRSAARSLFKYSLVFLALLFLALAVDRSSAGSDDLARGLAPQAVAVRNGTG